MQMSKIKLNSQYNKKNIQQDKTIIVFTRWWKENSSKSNTKLSDNVSLENKKNGK